MPQLFRNNAFSNLGASLTNSGTTLTVTAGHGDRFPVVTAPDFCLLTLQDASNNIEIVRVTARTVGSDSMTIQRAQEGTMARAWNIGDVVELRLTASALNPLALLEGSATAAAIRAILDVPTRTGGDASGTWNISATKLQTARTITIGNTGKSFDGSANVSWSLAEIGAAAATDTVNLTGDQTFAGVKTFSSQIIASGGVQGNADTATKLQTARTLTIGNTGKSVDGSENVSWSLDEIGAARFGVLADGTDLNTVVDPGFYRLRSSHGNAPPGISWGQLIVSRGGGDTILQIVTGHGNGEIFWRQGNPPDVGGSGSWSAWHRFIHSGNLGAALADAFRGANQSLSGNGFQRLPGGLILQWGTTGSIPVDGSLSVTFPIAFPTACASVVAQQTLGVGGSGTVVPGWSIPSRTSTGFQVNNDGGVQVFYWIAIGY